jgi:hypothetical protein
MVEIERLLVTDCIVETPEPPARLLGLRDPSLVDLAANEWDSIFGGGNMRRANLTLVILAAVCAAHERRARGGRRKFRVGA